MSINYKIVVHWASGQPSTFLDVRQGDDDDAIPIGDAIAKQVAQSQHNNRNWQSGIGSLFT